MRFYINHLDDFIIILLIEFLRYTSPIWYYLILLVYYSSSMIIKKYIYIPQNKEINLQKILLVYTDVLIFYDTANLNNYNIKTKVNDKNIHIIGNSNYVIINYSFYTINNHSNISRTPDNKLLIYKLPIKLYDQDECCVCYVNQGYLVGLCGHQNICIHCCFSLKSCPMCNNTMLLSKLNPKVISFINSA